MKEVDSSRIFSHLYWDSVGVASRVSIMAALLKKFELEDGSLDIPRLSKEMNDTICLFIPRITSMLETNLQKRTQPFYHHVTCLCMMLLTDPGQQLACDSPLVMNTLAKTLEYDQCVDEGKKPPRENDLIASLVMLKKVCCLNDSLRKTILHLRAMSLVSTLMQRVHHCEPLQEAGRHFLLDLATVDESASMSLTVACRKLLNSAQLGPKQSAAKIWTAILRTNTAVTITIDDWGAEAENQLTRLLLCAPLSVQYDMSALLSVVFSKEASSELANRMMNMCGAVMCLRYTLGGGSLVQPPLDWDMKFYEGYALEAPEIIVCDAISTALKYCLDNKNHTALQVVTQKMRESKLHIILMAHIFWYIRDRDIMHKVVSQWSGGSSSQAKGDPKLKFALRIKLWLIRMNKDRFMHPEIRRATMVVSHAVEFIQNKNKEKNLNTLVQPDRMSTASCRVLQSLETSKDSLELNAQELSCLNSIATLQSWVQMDAKAARDIEAEFTQLEFEDMVDYIEVEHPLSAKDMPVIDIVKSMANVMTLVRHDSKDMSKPHLFGKTGFRSAHLSKQLFPGQLVKNVKVALSEAVQLERGSQNFLEQALEELSSCFEPSHVSRTSANPSLCCSTFHANLPKESPTVEEMPSVAMEDDPPSPSSLIKVVTLSAGSPVPRLDGKVVPPRRSKCEAVVEGRVTRWQDDEANHQKGKAHWRRMSESGRLEEMQALAKFGARPSPPKKPRPSHAFSREPAKLPPSGIPPPELGDLSVVSVHSVIDSFLRESTGSPNRRMESRGPTSRGREAFGVGSISDSVASSVEESRSETLHTGNKSTCQTTENAFPDIADVSRVSTGNVYSYGGSRGARLSDSQGKNGHSAATRAVSVPLDPPVSEPEETLSKPQTFALQMIRELAELKGRGEKITKEEADRLNYINRTITTIIENESNMVDEISDRLDTMRDEKSEVISPSKKTNGDPLLPHRCVVRFPQPMKSANDSDLIPYKKYSAIHSEKNQDILSDLASRRL